MQRRAAPLAPSPQPGRAARKPHRESQERGGARQRGGSLVRRQRRAALGAVAHVERRGNQLQHQHHQRACAPKQRAARHQRRKRKKDAAACHSNTQRERFARFARLCSRCGPLSTRRRSPTPHGCAAARHASLSACRGDTGEPRLAPGRLAGSVARLLGPAKRRQRVRAAHHQLRYAKERAKVMGPARRGVSAMMSAQATTGGASRALPSTPYTKRHMAAPSAAEAAWRSAAPGRAPCSAQSSGAAKSAARKRSDPSGRPAEAARRTRPSIACSEEGARLQARVHGARGWRRGGREDEAVAQRDGAARPPRARAGGGRPGGALWRQQVTKVRDLRTKNGAENAKRRAHYPSATRGLGALLQRPRAPGSSTDAKAASASRLACCMMQLENVNAAAASFFVSSSSQRAVLAGVVGRASLDARSKSA